jgi:hypothetical protein
MQRTLEQQAAIRTTWAATSTLKNIISNDEIEHFIKLYDISKVSPHFEHDRLVLREARKELEIWFRNKFNLEEPYFLGSIQISLREGYFYDYGTPIKFVCSSGLDEYGSGIFERLPYKSIYIPLQVNYETTPLNLAIFITTEQHYTKDLKSIFTTDTRYISYRHYISTRLQDVEGVNTNKLSITQEKELLRFLPFLENKIYSKGMEHLSIEHIWNWQENSALVCDMSRLIGIPSIEKGVLQKMWMRINTYKLASNSV